MNIIKKEIELKIGEKEYIMAFDMTSIAIYKELTGKSFLQSSAKLGQFEDDLIIGFMGATLRVINKPNKPIGKAVYDMDLLNLLMNHSFSVIELITASMPQAGERTSKK